MITPPPPAQVRIFAGAVGKTLKLPLLVLCIASILLGVGAGYGFLRYGSLPAAIAAMRGEVLLVDQPLYSLVDVRPGSRVELRYVLTNVSDRPITLIGVSTSCSCTMLEDLPIVLAVSEARPVTATITTNESEPELDGSIRLYTDHPRSAEIVVGYSLELASPSGIEVSSPAITSSPSILSTNPERR